MTTTLPAALALYLDAEATADTHILDRCFTHDAVVKDEGKTMRGLDAIKSWKSDSQAKYQYRIEPLSTSQQGETVKVPMRITGRFPGSPIELMYTFVLSEDKIASLEIRPPHELERRR